MESSRQKAVDRSQEAARRQPLAGSQREVVGRKQDKSFWLATCLLLTAWCLLVAACSAGSTPQSAATPTPGAALPAAAASPAAPQAATTGAPSAVLPASSATGSATGLTPVTLAMGYIPNVQFAPLYVAVEKGYAREEGIDLKFDYGMESDLLKLAGTNKLQFVIGSGDQVILARGQGLPVVYVANWYHKFPVAVASLEKLAGPKDLIGKRVGIPMLSGASYIGWRALEYATGIGPGKVQLQVVGFTQVESLVNKQIDAAVVYATNEPVQLRQMGQDPTVIDVSQYIDLVANGLITNEKTMAENPKLVRSMVRILVRGLQDTLANPSEAFDIALKYAPQAGGSNREAQTKVLEDSLKYWQSPRIGYSDPKAWDTSVKFMRDTGLLQGTVDTKKLYTNDFVP